MVSVQLLLETTRVLEAVHGNRLLSPAHAAQAFFDALAMAEARFKELLPCPAAPPAAHEEAARLRAALAVVVERHLIPVECDDGWKLCVPSRPLTVTGHPAADTPEGALLAAQIEGRVGK